MKIFIIIIINNIKKIFSFCNNNTFYITINYYKIGILKYFIEIIINLLNF